MHECMDGLHHEDQKRLSTHIKMQFVCPLADHFVLSCRFVSDLILEDVVSSWRISVLIEDHRSPCTSCKTVDAHFLVPLTIKWQKKKIIFTNRYIYIYINSQLIDLTALIYTFPQTLLEGGTQFNLEIKVSMK